MVAHRQIEFRDYLCRRLCAGDENIRLGLLKRWLPMKNSDLPKLFEAILPGRNQEDQRYT